MKMILSGDIEYLTKDQILPVRVPYFSEFNTNSYALKYV